MDTIGTIGYNSLKNKHITLFYVDPYFIIEFGSN